MQTDAAKPALEVGAPGVPVGLGGEVVARGYRSAVDREWIRQQLNGFIDLATRYEATAPPGGIGEQGLWDELHRREPTIKQVLRRLDPDGEAINIDQFAGVAMARNEAHRGLGILNDLDEVNRRLAPMAPALSADGLHPWVWDGARTLWQSEHYREAVLAAAAAVNAHTQTKVGRRDVSDVKLMQEAFTDSAPALGKPRLRFPGDPSDPTVKSQQSGALQFGSGCFLALRNPAAHLINEWSQQEALERLAALSVLARIIDFCDVDYG